MALTRDTFERLAHALTNRAAAREIESAIVAGPPVAANVANFGSTTNLPAGNAALSTTDTYTDAAVNAAINSAVNTTAAVAETRLDNLESKVNAILTALKNAGMMTP